MLKVLTVNAECDDRFVFLAVFHSSVEDDASIARTVVVLGRCDGQRAGGLVIL